MKKNLVFVIPSLAAGGGEKSLVNLLNLIDYNQYNVDLILLHQSGIFLKLLPKEVKIIEIKGDYQIFIQSFGISIKRYLQQFKLQKAFDRMLFAFKNKIVKNKAVAEQSSWKNLEKAIPTFEKDYDVAIGFLEKTSIYLVVDKINATKKIGWIHTNYSSSGMNHKFDTSYFKKLDHIITVSQECATDLKENFPEFIPKIGIIHNIVSPKIIHDLSNITIVDDFFSFTTPILLTIGRLSPEKGIDIALEACKLLIDKGLNFKWFVIGDGEERSFLDTKIKEYKIEDYFILLGLKENPYPYLKKATIYIQPSRYEGKSIAIDEAKILQKPIIVTNFATAKDQINDLFSGILTTMNPRDMAQEIEKLINNKVQQDQLSLNLSMEQLGTEDEIHKLYAIINE